jgi:hypothetical protein
MHFRIADHLELLTALIGVLSIELPHKILPLPLDFSFTERIIVAGPVKVDNIPLAWILENRPIRTNGFSFDCRKPEMAILARGVRDFRNDAFRRL